MEFHKTKFRKSSTRGPRDYTSSGYRGQRADRSSGYRGPRDDRSSGYRGPRDDRSSGYRGPRDDRSSGYRGSGYGGPRNDRSSGYQGQRDDRSSGYRGQRDDRSSGYRGQRDDRSSGYRGQRDDRSSGYIRGPEKFQRDRTPIHSRESFGNPKNQQNRDESYRKNSKDYNPTNSNSFYSTLRTKLFTILGEKKCASCGFDNERALGFGQIDDIESFDYIQRAGAVSSWEKYISDPELARKKLQVICLNCNMIKQKAPHD